MGEPFFLSGWQRVGVSSGEDSSGWFVWEEMGNTLRITNQLTQTHTHTETCNGEHTSWDSISTHTYANSPSPALTASGFHPLHASEWREAQTVNVNCLSSLLLYYFSERFSLTWFYYIVIRWWVLSSALSALSSLLCHKFIDHSNWCMTAAVHAEDPGFLIITSTHSHSPSSCPVFFLFFFKSCR